MNQAASLLLNVSVISMTHMLLRNKLKETWHCISGATMEKSYYKIGYSASSRHSSTFLTNYLFSLFLYYTNIYLQGLPWNLFHLLDPEKQ